MVLLEAIYPSVCSHCTMQAKDARYSWVVPVSGCGDCLKQLRTCSLSCTGEDLVLYPEQ